MILTKPVPCPDVELHRIDVLDYIDRTTETGILISLDQEKAFDRVNRTFLLNLLSRFGFGPSFCFWINTLYNGANMRIIVNEWLSDAIPLFPVSPVVHSFR